ncbi:MAG: hypothetical protein HYX97_03535 [Chloroflexi bacterium]|nr:hypothetical protein [Chloroflexota bacterium]
MTKLRILGALLAALLAVALFGGAASAQQPPAIYFGTVTIDGQAVAAGTTVSVYNFNTLALIASTTTGSLSGQAANEYRVDVPAANAGVTVGFSASVGGVIYAFQSDGTAPSAVVAAGTATRTNLALVTPPPPPTATPVPATATPAVTPPTPGDIAPGTSALWGAVAAGLAMIAFGGVLMMRRRGSKA